MSGSIEIYSLPSKSIPDQLDYFPMSSETTTTKVSFADLTLSIDSSFRTIAASFQADDYVNVYGVTSGSRRFHPGNSIFYSTGTGSTNLILGNDVRLTNARTPVSHTHSLSEINTGSVVFLLSSSLGAANGVTPLNSLGKIDVSFIPTQSILDKASQISSSNLSILIGQGNVQTALEKLSDAVYIYVNSASINVNGTNSVQGALAQKLSTIGGTVTGPISLNGGFRVGASDLWLVTGSIGVGTTTPLSKLDVAGAISCDGNINVRRVNSVNDGGKITLYRSSDNTADWKMLQYGSSLKFSNVVGDKVTIDTNGNVGIGTTSPTQKLEIYGTAGVDGIKFPDGTTQTTAYVSGSGYEDIHINWPSTMNDDGMYIANHSTPSVLSYDILIKRLRSDYPSTNGSISIFPTGSIIMLSGHTAFGYDTATHVTSTKVFVTRRNDDQTKMTGNIYYGDIISYDQISGSVGYFELGAGISRNSFKVPYANRDWEMYVRLYY
jgi:hypothetical protein